MPYTIQIDAEHGVLDLRYQGKISIAQRFEAWDQVKPILHDTGVRRILIDLTDATPVPEPLGRHSEFVARITSEPILLESHTAFVVASAHPLNHLIEVLADSRHYPFSRFDTRADALAWLHSGAAPIGSNRPKA